MPAWRDAPQDHRQSNRASVQRGHMTIDRQRGKRASSTRRTHSAAAGTQAAGDCRVMFHGGKHPDQARRGRADAHGHSAPAPSQHRRVSAGARMRALHEAAAAAELERRRSLARALHDDFGQLVALAQIRLAELTLTPLSPNASRLAAQLSTVMSQASTALRRTCFELARPGEHGLDMAAAIEHHCRELGASFGQQIVFRCEGERPALMPSTAAVVLRAARELIVNACKHARAHRIDASMSCLSGELRLEVSDDGRGIVSEASRDEPCGFGLTSIRHQLDALGAQLRIAPSPSGGTLCSLLLPLPSQAQYRPS
ncbi:sensor histidine kinase [Caldimonas sp. KR1-144]|uniref:sensor histidine kinase n=1 Tax=Caldimonas sp. KR1-144 TaxID=3400911 RepID=UPI003C009E68